MRTYTKILPLAIALTACGGGGGSTNPVETPVSTTPPTTPPVTVTSTEEYCEGFTLYKNTNYSDDTVDTELLEENSEECGYVEYPPYGTPEGEEYCEGEVQKQDFADGEGGTYTEAEDLAPACFVQMEEPPACSTTASATGDDRYNYITCDGLLQKTDFSFPYSPEHPGTAIVDMAVFFDNALTDRDGMTVEEFTLYQLREANRMFRDSGVDIRLRLTGITMVDSDPTKDLRGAYYNFFYSRGIYTGVKEIQEEQGADIGFLFRKRPENPIACGVAQNNASRGREYSRGITQCFHNSVFQETVSTRYYERAYETFVHEVGHLLGLEHHWQEVDNPAGTGLYTDSYGYLIPGYTVPIENYEGVHSGYGTIMSYADKATGRFSDTSQTFSIPETGQSKRLGTSGGCWSCTSPPPATEAVKHLQRVRYAMSQLHGAQNTPLFSPILPNTPTLDWKFEIGKKEYNREPHICLF